MPFAKLAIAFIACLSCASTAWAEDITEARAALDALSRADLAGSTPGVEAVLDRWFPRYSEQGPCAPAAGLVASDVVCEWHAGASDPAGTSGLPDMFVSLSSDRLDSVVLRGVMPLASRNWQCRRTAGQPIFTICVPRTVPAGKRRRLAADWRTFLARAALAGQ